MVRGDHAEAASVLLVLREAARRARVWLLEPLPEARSVPAELTLLVCSVLALAVLAGLGMVAVVHIDDTYHVDHVAGAWLALSQYVGSGIVYPPLYDGAQFGGTRYMPLQFLIYGAVGWLSGDYLVGPKVVALLLFVLLLVLLYRVLRGFGCSRGLTVQLLAAVGVSFPGFFAATSTYGDTLPVLLQVLAVGLVARSAGRALVIAAAALCALAVMTKLSAVWAPAAITVWLLVQRPRRAVLFLGAYLGFALAALGILELISDGRLLENMRELAFSGSSSTAAPLTEAPEKLYEIIRDRAAVLLFLVPLALAAIVTQLSERRLSIYTLSLAFALPVLLVVLADQGTDFNHLLDLVVLTVICAGEFVARTTTRSPTRLLPLLAVVIIVGVAASYESELRADTRTAAASLIHRETPDRYSRNLMSRYIKPGDSLLSEDPSVPLLLDRTPILLDAFMLPRIGATHPQWRDDLVRRLDQHQFDTIVLIFELDLADSWWKDSHFGTPIATAINRNYCLSEAVLGGVFKYRIYRPRAAGCEPET